MIPSKSLNNKNDFEAKEKKTISSKNNHILKPILEEDEKIRLEFNKKNTINNTNNYVANSTYNQNYLSSPTEEKRLKMKPSHVIKKSSLISEKKTIVENESSAETSSNDNFSNSLFSNSDSDYLKTKKKKKKKLKNDYRTNKNMFIIDSIDSLYSKQKQTNKLLRIEYINIKAILLLTGIYNWILLFQTCRKLERNYCYDKNLNQFNACSQKQVCKKSDERLNLFLYNDTIYGGNFTKEIRDINYDIKTFYSKFFFELSRKKVFGKLQINIDDSERENFVVILNSHEKWNFIYKFYSICNYTNYHYILIISYTIGGIIGGFLLGFLSDIFGRKKIIRFCLIFLSIISCLFLLFFQYMNIDENRFKKEFKNNYNLIDFEGTPYLSLLYVQTKMRNRLEKIFFILQILFYLVGFFIIPLKNNCISLITENSLNANNLMKNYRDSHFAIFGMSPFIAYCIIVLVNNLLITFSIISIFSVLLTILSFFFLDESMRHLFEYCDWRGLSYAVKRLLNDLDDKDYRNEHFLKLQENTEEKYIYKMFNGKRDSFSKQKKINFYSDLKHKTQILKTNISRNIDIIIRKKEIMKYPYLIFICLISNPKLQNSKITLMQTLILVFLVDNLLRSECLTLSFLGKKELFFGKNYNNYIINSNFFIYSLTLLASNNLYYCLFRIISFKGVILVSLILISFFSILYHILTYISEPSSIDLNRYNYGMLLQYQEESSNNKNVTLIFLSHFFMNGITFLMSLVILKYTNTLYRGTIMGIMDGVKVLTFLLSSLIKEEMEYSMLFTGVMNLIGIFTIFFLDDLKEQPNIINDLKKNSFYDEDETKNN